MIVTFLSTLTNWLKNSLLLIVTLVILLLILEVGIRYLTQQPPRLIERDAAIGTRYQPNLDVSLIGPESGRKVHIRTNSIGFRGAESNLKKAANTIRVAVLGDSQIAAINTPESESFTGKLESKLRQHLPGMNWEVLNFGVSGASTAQELNLYRKLVSDYAPDLVILAFYNGNDFSDNSRQLSSNPRVYMSLEQGELVTHYPRVDIGPVSWLKHHSRFYNWQKIQVRKLRRRLVRGGWLGEKRRLRGGLLAFVADPQESRLTAAWELTRKTLETLATEVQDNDSKFLMFNIPHALEFRADIQREIRARFASSPYQDQFEPRHAENKLQSFAAAENIPAVWFGNRFREAFDAHRQQNSDFSLTYLDGRGHLNSNGHELLAETVRKYIQLDTNGHLVVSQW